LIGAFARSIYTCERVRMREWCANLYSWDRFDVDRSGSISFQEFQDALTAFGYRLSPNFVQLLFGTYAKKHSRGRGDDGEREKVLSFDLFVQACISLKRMTDVFKKYDSDRDGYITLSL
jgi:peflin